MSPRRSGGGVATAKQQQNVFAPAKAFEPSRPNRPSPLAASTIRGIPVDLVERIRSFSFFANAPDEFLVAVGSCLRLQVYSAQESILNEGDEAKAMYWLIRGAVMVTSRDRESVYVELPPGSFFGEIGIMMNVPRTASIVAKYKSLVARLNKEDLQKQLPKYPAVERALREEAAERLAILERKKSKGPTPLSSTPKQMQRKSSKRTHDLLHDDVEMMDYAEGDDSRRGNSNKKLKSPSPPSSVVETAASSALAGFGNIHIRSLLKELPLFSRLPDEFLHFLGLNAEPRTYPPFTTILKQRSFGRDVFFVTEGMVEVFTDGPTGSETPPEGITPKHIIRARLQSGQYFGEVSSLSLAPQRTASVRTITSVECLVISGDVIDELWRRCPPELRSSVEATARRRMKANEDMDFGNFKLDDADEEQTNDEDVTMAGTADAAPQPPKAVDKPQSALAFKDVTYQSPTKYSSMDPEPYDPDPFLNTERPSRRNPLSRRGSLANVPTEGSPLAEKDSRDSMSLRSKADEVETNQTTIPSRPRLASTQTSPTGKGMFPDNVLTCIFQNLDVGQLMRLRVISAHWSRLLTRSPDILEVLDLSVYNRRVNDSVLSDVIAPFVGSRPRSIDISNCFHLTDEGFSNLFQKCGENVTHLRMKSVWDITPHAIVQMINKASNLISVDFSNCRKVSDNLLNRVVGWVVRRPSNPNAQPSNQLPEGTIIGCPKLSQLTLSYCKHVSDRFMLHLAHHASDRLEQMDLTRCTTISDVGFRHWGDRTFPRLSRLILADCTYLSDNAIVCLTQAARNLRELDLSFCCALSDASVDRLASSLHYLQSLNLAFCGSAVSDASMASIGNGLRELRDVSVRGCVRVTGTGVEAILQGCPTLEAFDVSQCRNLVMNEAWENGKVKFLTVADGTWRVNN